MTDEKEFEAFKAYKARKAHRESMNKWVIENRRKVHSAYTRALTVFDDVHARPQKWCTYAAEEALKKALIETIKP